MMTTRRKQHTWLELSLFSVPVLVSVVLSQLGAPTKSMTPYSVSGLENSHLTEGRVQENQSEIFSPELL
jgi:hypothetical protein